MLITLVIIGVIAAATIPTLINNTNKEELRTGLLKSQTVISNALELYYSKNGIRLLPDELRNNRGRLYSELKKYLSVAKDCGYSGCASVVDGVFPYKTFPGNRGINTSYIDDGQLILNDGMGVYFENSAGNVYIIVDVNGIGKKPNKAGHDLFYFQLNDDGYIVPMGAEGPDYYSATDEYCSKTSTGLYNGMGCTAKALSDDDYFKKLPR